MRAIKPLSPFERWMVKSNLEHAKTQGMDFIVSVLRANGYLRVAAAVRLEYLRGELRAERISYGELHELQSLIPHIAPDDVELLEAAGVPEFPNERKV